MNAQDINIKKEALKALNQFEEVKAAIQLIYDGKQVGCMIIGNHKDLKNIIANTCLQQPSFKAFLANGLGLALEYDENLDDISENILN